MSFTQELTSWLTPTKKDVQPAPKVGDAAPSTELLRIPSTKDTRPVVVTFLRHCGCPFAEKTYLSMRSAAASNPSIRFVAVSHSSRESTDKWLEAVSSSSPSDNHTNDVEVLVDASRDVFAAWGLGISSLWHVLSPWALYDVWKLGKQDQIWNRPTETGSRWQTAGTWAVDASGVVKGGGVAESASDMPDFGPLVGVLQAAR